MASNNPGIATVPMVEDPVDDTHHKPSLSGLASSSSGEQRKISATLGGDEKNRSSSDIPSDEKPVAPDQFDPTYETGKWEIWAYYSYYIGNNGLTLFNFAPTAFQNLLSEAAGDDEMIYFAGGVRTIESVVLQCNGISFAIQIVVFLIIGSYAGKLCISSVYPKDR